MLLLTFRSWVRLVRFDGKMYQHRRLEPLSSVKAEYLLIVMFFVPHTEKDIYFIYGMLHGLVIGMAAYFSKK